MIDNFSLFSVHSVLTKVNRLIETHMEGICTQKCIEDYHQIYLQIANLYKELAFQEELYESLQFDTWKRYKHGEINAADRARLETVYFKQKMVIVNFSWKCDEAAKKLYTLITKNQPRNHNDPRGSKILDRIKQYLDMVIEWQHPDKMQVDIDYEEYIDVENI